MSLILVSGPAADELPVSLQEIKDHCRVSGDDDDTYLGSLLKVASTIAEDITRRRFLTQTWDYFLEDWPCSSYLEIPYPKLQSVTTVKYKDGAGALVTWSNSEYEVDANAHVGSVRLNPGFTAWPSLYTNSTVDRVQIRFVCGYGAATLVPDPIKHAIKFLVALWYRDREPVALGMAVNKIPLTFDLLLAPYRIYNFA